ncbi:hypothetical protein [Bradyrhizobium diazoefficiens]|uniref:DUF2937 domain-containing protein n=1 Tax=Bradyrhizobium diazoefficiens TaxID=1355477 RepID=A0A810BVV6_9BRAD|nr:hypothetical protein XF9B_09010 [Bradyrhizobium diazoefficiens]BCE96880.1 hypothetical protein XF11B_09010 [Bradyrhizobium diazoefficiens]BCF05531.1 hypothetical protein XF12B_09040 [Bradyrhizobium diazoefficiens]BCF57951.1 hypothetical protein XF18B_08990 [Bradyrhizobium diazoefficiens]
MKTLRLTIALLGAALVAVPAEGQQAPLRSKNQLARTVLAEVEQRFQDLPWTQSIDGEFSKAGAYLMGGFPGYSWSVLRMAIKTNLAEPSLLLGSSLLEQVQYIYLLRYDEFELELKRATARDSDLWKSSPLDALKLARSVASYSSSDAIQDNVLALSHVGFPFILVALLVFRRLRRTDGSSDKITVRGQIS